MKKYLTECSKTLTIMVTMIMLTFGPIIPRAMAGDDVKPAVASQSAAPQAPVEPKWMKVPRNVNAFNKVVRSSCKNLLLRNIPRLVKTTLDKIDDDSFPIPKNVRKFLQHDVPMRSYKTLIYLGWGSSMIPMFKALGNEKKFYNLAIERPMMGLISTPVGVLAANAMMGHGVWDWAHLARTTVEQYFSFTMSNFPRNSVALNESLMPWTRLLLDYIFSVTYYSVGTGSFDLFHAIQQHSAAALTIGVAKVLYSFLWPILSRPIGQTLTIGLYSRFPSQPVYTSACKAGFDRKTWTENQDKKIKSLEKNIAGLKSEDIESKKAEIAELKDLEKTKGNKRRIKLRVMQLARLEGKLRQKKIEFNTAKAEYFWVDWLRKDLKDDEAVSGKRQVAYRAIKQSIETSVSTSLISLYLGLRGATVGEKFDLSMPLQNASQHVIHAVENFEHHVEVSMDGFNPNTTIDQLANTAAELQPDVQDLMQQPEFAAAMTQEAAAIDQSGGVENNMSYVFAGQDGAVQGQD